MSESTEVSNNDLLDILNSTILTDGMGTTRYYNSDGELHRVYGPAEIHLDGTKKWYHNGKLHRQGHPAVIQKDGLTEYWFLGKKMGVGIS